MLQLELWLVSCIQLTGSRSIRVIENKVLLVLVLLLLLLLLHCVRFKAVLSNLRKWSIKSISLQVWSIHTIIAFTSVGCIDKSVYNIIIIDSQKPQNKTKMQHFLAFVPLKISILNDAMEIRLRLFLFFVNFATDSVIFQCCIYRWGEKKTDWITRLSHE